MSGIFPVLFALLFWLAGSPVSAKASATGTFLSVSGKVWVKSQAGGPGRPAKAGMSVKEGERVITDKDSGAVLRFFDGSELSVRARTDFWLSRLSDISHKDKILKFKMLMGGLVAKVTQLLSADSQFEIEAGGVVCGVRGTQFSMDFNPDAGKVLLEVFEGTVYSRSRGHSRDFGAGSRAEFLNGRWMGSLPPAPPGNPVLDDVDRQFRAGVLVTHDAGQNDPAVGGGSALNLRVNVPPQENAP